MITITLKSTEWKSRRATEINEVWLFLPSDFFFFFCFLLIRKGIHSVLQCVLQSLGNLTLLVSGHWNGCCTLYMGLNAVMYVLSYTDVSDLQYMQQAVQAARISNGYEYLNNTVPQPFGFINITLWKSGFPMEYFRKVLRRTGWSICPLPLFSGAHINRPQWKVLMWNRQRCTAQWSLTYSTRSIPGASL